MCLAPVTLYVRDRAMDDEHTKRVPCGKCPECKKRRSKAWSFRIYQEMKNATSAYFLTFTYAETPFSPLGIPTLKKKDFQLFMKRLRKEVPHIPYIKSNGKTGKRSNIKYYACGEYGTTTKRPHYHAIMLNVPDVHNLLAKTWPHGHVDIAPVTMATIQYVTNYIQKPAIENTEYVDTTTGEVILDQEKEFSLMSKGMGKSYLTPQMIKFHKDNMLGVITGKGGQLQGLPRYLKEKIFTKEEIKQITQEQKKLFEFNLDEKIQNDPEYESKTKKDKYRKYIKSLKHDRNTI